MGRKTNRVGMCVNTPSESVFCDGVYGARYTTITPRIVSKFIRGRTMAYDLTLR